MARKKLMWFCRKEKKQKYVAVVVVVVVEDGTLKNIQ